MARKENPIPAGDIGSLPLGAQMRHARRLAGATLAELAARLGYSKAHLSAVENRIVWPSRELVTGYERALAQPPGQLTNVYDRQRGRESSPAGAAIDGRVTSPPAIGEDSLDAMTGQIGDDLQLAPPEAELVRQLVAADIRERSRAVRAALDWWQTTGPVDVCCIPIAGWQWREWTPGRIFAAVDRAAAEAMQARIREVIVVLPPEHIADLELEFSRPSFAQRLQQLYCVGQAQPRGLGHAILQAQPLIGDRPFAVVLPDNHFDRYGEETAILRQLVDHFGQDRQSLLAVAQLKISRRRYGLARLHGPAEPQRAQPIELLVEKPEPNHPISRCEPPCDPQSVCAILGRYVLSPAVLPVLAQLGRDLPAGRTLELIDALQWLIDHQQETVAAWKLPSIVQLESNETVFVATQPMSSPPPDGFIAA